VKFNLSNRHLIEWLEVMQILRAIVHDLADVACNSTTTIRITSIYRNHEEEIRAGGRSGIHTCGPPYRAIDIAGRTFKRPGDDDARLMARLRSVASKLNRRWSYDANRPTKKVALAHVGTGAHIHLQVHPHTRKR